MLQVSAPPHPPVRDEASFRYEGWRVVAVCFVMAIFTWAFGFYGHSVFVAELHRIHGWPTSLISSATTGFYLFGAMLVALLGEVMRRIGARQCLLGGALTMAAAAVLLGQVSAPWQLYCVYALLAVGWAGTSLGAITTVLGLWFDTRRGMAISLALNGASFGGILGAPVLALMIGWLGFPAAMLVGGATMALVLAPLILAFVGRPPLRRRSDGAAAMGEAGATYRADAMRTTRFWTVTVAFSLALFAQVGFLVHLVTYLDPLVGRQKAALAISIIAIMAVVGRVLFSVVIDRLNQRLAASLSFLSQGIALAVLINARDPALLLAACGLLGFSVGNLITMPALIVQREFDPRAFGALIGLTTAAMQVTYAFGPGFVGLVRDAAGGYAAAFYACIAIQTVAAIVVLVRGQGSRSETSPSGSGNS